MNTQKNLNTSKALIKKRIFRYDQTYLDDIRRDSINKLSQKIKFIKLTECTVGIYLYVW